MLNIDRNDARKRDISTMMSSCVFVLFVLLVVLVASIRGACENEQPQNVDFSSFGSSDLITSRTKSVCDVSVTVYPKVNETLFFIPSVGIGVGQSPINDTELRPGTNEIRMDFATRMRIIGISLAALLNQPISVTVELVFGPLSPEEMKAGAAITPNRSVNVTAPAGANFTWSPPANTDCITLYIRTSSMPLSTLMLRSIELRSLGLNVAPPPRESAIYGPDDNVVVFGTAYRRVTMNTTASRARVVDEPDIWSSWIPWTAIIGSALVLCVCVLIILMLRKRIKTVTDKKADKFFSEIEQAKAVHE